MANVKNFGLIGVADNVQYGKAGPKLKHTTGTFNFRNAADAADAALTSAGITSSAGGITATTGNISATAGSMSAGTTITAGTGFTATTGNVTATTGNLVLTATGATVVVGTDTTLSRQQAGVFQFNGTAAVIVPTGTAAQRPVTPAEGMFRYNQDTDGMEYYSSGSSAWETLAFAGGSVASITGTANQITASSPTGAVTLSIPSTFIAPGTVTASTGLTVTAGGALVTLGGVTISTLTANSFLYSGTAGLLTTTAAPTNGQLLIGSTGVAPVAAALTAGTGISITNGAGSITVGNTGVTSVDVSGGTTGLSTSGGPVTTTGTITLAGTLVLANGGTSASLTASNGSIVYSTASAMAMSSVGTLGDVLTSSGAGAPTWTGTATANTASTLVKRDASGNFSAGIGSFLGSGSASGVTLNGTVTAATDATTKLYVDSLVQGIAWKQAVRAATTTSGTLATSFENGDVIDGVTLATGNRILIKNQAGTVSATAAAGGSGYSVSDVLTVVGGTFTSAATFTVATVSSGAVATVTLLSAGTYTVYPTSPVATTVAPSGGTGATLNVIWPGAENGIYTVNASGAPTRALDMDAASEFDGAGVFVQEGTVNNSTGWTETATVTIVGTDQVTFVQFSGTGSYTAGAGLTLTGTSFSVNVASATMFITGGNSIAVDSSATANQVLLSSGTVGNEATYGAVPLGNSNAVTGTLLAVNGGTGFAVYAVGDLLYADTTTTLAKLADVAAGSYLRSGGVSTAPVWSTTTLPNSATTGDLLYASASNTYSNLADVATGNVLRAGGVGVAPSYGQVVLTTDVTGTLPVANGGTGATTLTATAVLLGNGTSAITTDALLTFVTATNTLTVGTSTISAVDAGDLTITATATNANINLNPNGTGAVVIGPVGAGLIQSDPAQPLTVRGNTTLTLTGVTGATLQSTTSGNVAITSVAGVVVTAASGNDIVMTLANNTTDKVSLATVTAVNYATGLADNDLVNKYYVDTVAGSAAGDVKAFKQVVPLSADGTTNIGTVLPTGATILSVKVNVTVTNPTATLSVGISGGVSDYMTTAENDPQTVGMYLAETMVVNTAVQIIATVAAQTTGVGSATVVVTYQIAN